VILYTPSFQSYSMMKPLARRSLRLCLRHGGVSKELGAKPESAVFQIPELLTEIVYHCSWSSCINLSHSAVHARFIVHNSIRRRIHDILEPFVDDVSTFFALIHETKSAIVGSAAWNVMSVDNVAAQDVNIVVPNGSIYGVDRLKALLSCSGTTVIFDGLPGIIYKNCATRFIKLMRNSVSSVKVHPYYIIRFQFY
jgi:hypothetical protein